MALIKCPECGHDVSDHAEICPHCGYALKVKDGKNQSDAASSYVDNAGQSDSSTQTESDSDKQETTIREDNPVQQKQDPVTKKPVNKKGIIIGILCAIAVIIILAAALSRVLLSSSEKQAVAQMQSDIAAIGEVTKESGDDIKHAEDEYAALSDKCRKHIENYPDLLTARSDYNNLLAKNAEERIAKIKNITVDSEQDIQDAKDAYASLTEEQKALVTNAALLDDADQRLIEAKAAVVEEEIDNIGELHAGSGTGGKLKKIRKDYSALDDDVKAAVKNIGKLDEAEKKYSDLRVQNVIGLIDDIGDVTLKKGNQIYRARSTYNELDDEEKERVTNADVLEKDWDTYSKLKAEQDKKDKEAAEKAKILKVGDTIKTSKWELTLKAASITSRINPNDTSGYFLYYPSNDGSVFVDLIFTAKNISSTMQGLDYIFDDYSVEYGERVYDKDFTVFASTGSRIDQVYSWDGLDSLNTCTLHLATQLPADAKNNDKSIVVNVDIDGVTKKCTVKK